MLNSEKIEFHKNSTCNVFKNTRVSTTSLVLIQNPEEDGSHVSTNFSKLLILYMYYIYLEPRLSHCIEERMLYWVRLLF